MTAERALVVGASIAGISAARGLIDAGFGGSVVLLGDEAVPPYERPALSKSMLTGDDPEPPWLMAPDELAASGVDFLPGTAATALDTARRLVRDDAGDEHPYDVLVIATGSTPRRLQHPPMAGVHYLRNLADARALRASLRAGGPVVVVGGGFIGLEVASSARTLGRQVTVVEAAPRLFAGSPDGSLSRRVAALHRDNGVELRLGVGVARFVGDGRVQAVELRDGTRLDCTTCVIGVGIRPSTDWLDGSGLLIDDGVRVDEFGFTGTPGVWSVGDVARIAGARRGEHWTAARSQGTAVARNMVHHDRRRSLCTVPYAWSDQHGMKIQIVGDAHDTDSRHEVDLDIERGRFFTTYYRRGRAVGGVGISAASKVAALRRELESRLLPA